MFGMLTDATFLVKQTFMKRSLAIRFRRTLWSWRIIPYNTLKWMSYIWHLFHDPEWAKLNVRNDADKSVSVGQG